MASAKFNDYKSYFDTKKWSKDMIHMAVERGYLTEEEYKTITGDDYQPIIYRYETGTLNQMSEQRLIQSNPAKGGN